MRDEKTSCVSAEQMQEYIENGFFIVRRLVAPEPLRELAEHLDRAALGKLSPGIFVQVEPEVQKSGAATGHPLDRVRKVAHLAKNDPFFRSFVSQDRILGLMRGILGANIRYFGDEAQLKPPFLGSAHPWHQDAPYFHPEPFPCATVWIAVDPATRENGCMEVIPGGHKKGILPRRTGQAWFEDGELDISQAVPACLEPGDALVFHVLLPHGSGPNRTSLRRRSMIARYVNVDALSASQAHVVIKNGGLEKASALHPIFRDDFALELKETRSLSDLRPSVS